jgi:hypothetical protein
MDTIITEPHFTTASRNRKDLEFLIFFLPKSLTAPQTQMGVRILPALKQVHKYH